jgi:hypothetical protein
MLLLGAKTDTFINARRRVSSRHEKGVLLMQEREVLSIYERRKGSFINVGRKERPEYLLGFGATEWRTRERKGKPEYSMGLGVKMRRKRGWEATYLIDRVVSRRAAFHHHYR